jgi:Cu(I)/Ag(I) efflux system periplasmic protein CusF
MRKFILAAALCVAFLPASAMAQPVPADGQVTKVDVAAGKITLKHGPIKNLDMDAMTMVFRVKDAAMLSAVKAGDRVRFEAERVDGAITLTKIEKVR